MSGKKPVWVDEQAHQLLKAWSKLKKSPMLALASNLVLEHLDLDSPPGGKTAPVKAAQSAAPEPTVEVPAPVVDEPAKAEPVAAAPAAKAPAPVVDEPTKAEPVAAAPAAKSPTVPSAPEPAAAPRESRESRPADAPRPASQKVAARGQSKTAGKRKELPGDELAPIEDKQNLFYGGVLILP